MRSICLDTARNDGHAIPTRRKILHDREPIRSLFAWRSGAREEFEVKDRLQATAGGGDRFAIVLGFEFLSRTIASTQSMKTCRHRRPALNESDISNASRAPHPNASRISAPIAASAVTA